MDTAIYNNLLSNFDPKYTTKYAHKSSELRSVVKRIRNQALSSPVYLVDFNDKKQSYVLGVKESSMKIVDSLSTLADDSTGSLFSQKQARSTDINQVEADLIDGSEEKELTPFSIKVKQLANSQVNVGKEYYETGKGLEAGSYQFKVTVNDIGYDFQYNVKKDANNREVIQGLSDFITKAKVGLVATPYSTEADKIGMRIESMALGTSNGYDNFSLSDKQDGTGKRGIVNYYGLNNISVSPKNAVFDLNGVEKTSMSNEFILDRAVKVSLRGTSEEKADVIYQPDSELILDGVQQFVDRYNELVGCNVSFSEETGHPSKLLSELKGIMSPFKNELESYGIQFDEKGFMSLDGSLGKEAVDGGELEKMFKADSLFVMKLATKCDNAKINPMEYIDKRIVSYPNFQKPPRGYSYISSLYSGLLFNSYC